MPLCFAERGMSSATRIGITTRDTYLERRQRTVQQKPVQVIYAELTQACLYRASDLLVNRGPRIVGKRLRGILSFNSGILRLYPK